MTTLKTELQEAIFFDRYALKDATRTHVEVGQKVIVVEDQKRRIGQVVYNDGGGEYVVVQFEGNSTGTLIPLKYIDIPLEFTPDEMIARVAKGIASVEKTPELQQYWEKEFISAMQDWKFVPAGRILAAAGTDQALTYYNCFVIPHPHDSRHGLFEAADRMCEIMSRGGGVGMNLSTLRPNRAVVRGVNGRSSGPVSWAELYSLVTERTEQAGSRRGALMLILDVWHPDILEFINSKRTAGKITNANISVGLSDDFMRAVENDESWVLRFPDTSHPSYNELWKGDIQDWENRGLPVIHAETVSARKIWDAIIESAWASAEPGLFFTDRYNAMSNSYYYAKIFVCNPCGEQGIPPWAVCNLGAIYLAAFYNPKTNSVNWGNLGGTIETAVRFLDNVIDATPYFSEDNERQQLMERRVGLNTMGVAELLILCGIRYGSEESLDFLDDLYAFIRDTAYETSIKLSAQRGPFPAFDAEKFLESGFAQTLPAGIRHRILNYGIRNVTLLTQAPNGTIGTMVGTSTGIEPYFALEWERTSRLGTYTETADIVTRWREANPGRPLPDYFVTAMDLSPYDHVAVAAKIQEYIDSSISKTCNVPNDWTTAQVSDLYWQMYKSGCKGGTIYRDGSRDTQVLNLKKEEVVEEVTPDYLLKPIPSVRYGKTYTVKTHLGTLHITLNFDEAYNLLDVFLNIGKAGSDLQADAEAMGRLISTILRINSPLTDAQRIEVLIDQLEHIGGSGSMGFGPSKISSLADAVANVLREDNKTFAPDTEEYSEEEWGEIVRTAAKNVAEWTWTMQGVLKKETDEIAEQAWENLAEQIVKTRSGDICPSCHSASFVRSEGCQTCTSCGYSKC